MSGLIINQIIATANYEMRMAIDRLQVEESGRDVAQDQGKVAGWKELISNLSANFHLIQALLEDNGEEPVSIPDLSDEELEAWKIDADLVRSTDEWKAVIARIEENILMLKNHLLFCAEKTRDLDIDQGKYRAQMIYQNVFEAIERELSRREAKKKEDKDAMPLFEGDAPAVADRVIDFAGA